MRRTALTAGLAALLAAFAAAANALHGQTVDVARLTAGIAVGWSGGTDLWTVERQPIASITTAPDIFSLRRSLFRDVAVNGQVTMFPNPHLGFTGEFTLLGLRTEDGCTIVEHHGDPSLVAACDSLHQTVRSATTTTLHGGIVLRPFSGGFLQPFVKATAGLAFVPSSTVEMRSIYGHVNDTTPLVLTIYNDASWHSIRPSWGLAAGISTAPSRAMQLRVEVRETWFTFRSVTGPTSGQGYVPPTAGAVSQVMTVLVGLDVVFARNRGRRY